MTQRAASPLFIASLGNPGSQYAHTLHSAGHVVLSLLTSCAGAAGLSKSPMYEKAEVSEIDEHDEGAASRKILFWRSPSFMNTSGPALARSFAKFARTSDGNTGDETSGKTKLIVLHDELELPLGKFKISSGAGKSARGHNGLKSVLEQSSFKNLNFTRVGIGIGPRPESRETNVIAKFVLRRLKPADEEKLSSVSIDIWRRLASMP